MLASITRRCLNRIIGTDAALLEFSAEAEEEVIGNFGHVSICRGLPGCYAQIRVHGALDVARGVALEQLVEYAKGNNARAQVILAARPIIQEKLAGESWLVRIRLDHTPCLSDAPAPCADDVQLVMREAEIVATLTMSGRPGCQKIANAASEIRTVIDRSKWSTIGGAQLRLHCAPAVLPFLGAFEVAIPLIYRGGR